MKTGQNIFCNRNKSRVSKRGQPPLYKVVPTKTIMYLNQTHLQQFPKSDLIWRTWKKIQTKWWRTKQNKQQQQKLVDNELILLVLKKNMKMFKMKVKVPKTKNYNLKYISIYCSENKNQREIEKQTSKKN